MKLFRSLGRAAIPALAATTFIAIGIAYASLYNFPFASLTASTANRTAATLPMTGSECVPGDTNLTGGRAPQTACYTQGNLKGNYAVELTDAPGSTVTWDTAGNANLYILNMTGVGGNARTISAPTSQVTGKVTHLLVTQTATGSQTITWNAAFKWPAVAANGQPTAPTLTTTAGRSDLFQFVSDGTSMYATPFSVGTVSQNRQ